jgi:hypothetical protein
MFDWPSGRLTATCPWSLAMTTGMLDADTAEPSDNGTPPKLSVVNSSLLRLTYNGLPVPAAVEAGAAAAVAFGVTGKADWFDAIATGVDDAITA